MLSRKKTDSCTTSFSHRKSILLGLDSDSIIKKFFGSTAMVAILVLGLITIFLFKEGAGFIGLYHKSLKEYRGGTLKKILDSIGVTSLNKLMTELGLGKRTGSIIAERFYSGLQIREGIEEPKPVLILDNKLKALLSDLQNVVFLCMAIG